MRFLHLSDLHLGKRVNEFSMLEDQAYILKEILNIIDEQKVEAVLIAGDVYDKVIPPAEAVRLLDDFLTRLAARELPVFLISGNHDSAERVAFGSRLMSSRQIYLSPVFESDVEPITISDRYGEINIYMLPFVKPSLVKRVYPEEEIITYQDAVNAAVQHMQIDTDKRNILLAHQFVTGAARCDSEELSVGGVDDVDAAVFEGFDYVALGHLHGAQYVSRPKIRYCGTLLKYSVSESTQTKSLTVVTLKEKGEKPEIACYPLHPLRDVRKKKGTLEEIIKEAGEEEKEDYISITLTDEIDPYKPKEQLERVFSHILEIRVDNQRTRTKLKEMDEELVMKDPFTSFCEFYKEMQGREMNTQEETIMKEIFDNVKGVE